MSHVTYREGNVAHVSFDGTPLQSDGSLAETPALTQINVPDYLWRFERACTAETPKIIYDSMLTSCSDAAECVQVVWSFQRSEVPAARIVAARFAGRCLIDFFTPGILRAIERPFGALLIDESDIVAAQAREVRRRYLAAASSQFDFYRRRREMGRIGSSADSDLPQ